MFVFFTSSLFFPSSLLSLFFFNDTPPTEIYTLSLHDALPISPQAIHVAAGVQRLFTQGLLRAHVLGDRKSTRLNSSHTVISYAVFCLKKKKNKKKKKR